MTNAYVDLATFKGGGALNISGTIQDTALRQLLERASRAVDRMCNRHFYVFNDTKVFDGGGDELTVPDLVSIDASGLLTDDDRDRTYETTWAATDYLLAPTNAQPTSFGNAMSRPYVQVLVDVDAGTKTTFPPGRRTVQITGQWGYWHHAEPTADTVQDNPLSASATVINVADGTKFSAGQTLLLEAEQAYVTAVSANALTVLRGVNGTVAASHVQTTAIAAFAYPAEVVQATMMQAARWWRRKDAAYGARVGLPPSGQRPVAAGLDPDVAYILTPYVRFPIGV